MDKNKTLYLLGKDTEDGKAYVTATVPESGESHEAVLLFESPYDAYKMCKDNFDGDEDMSIYETSFEAIEELEDAITFVFIERSLEAEGVEASKKNLMC